MSRFLILYQPGGYLPDRSIHRLIGGSPMNHADICFQEAAQACFTVMPKPNPPK